MSTSLLHIRWLGLQPYEKTWAAMRSFTDERQEDALDEIWLLEHTPVFTQGQNGKPEHVLNTSNIPIVQTDRGGQVTYHGPGQLMIYTLIDLRRKKFQIRELVTRLEQSIIDFLSHLNISAIAKRDAPGVYVNEKKIASIGLRIRRGCSYHGIAFNVAMDLSPFKNINPCGYQQLEMTQIADFMRSESLEATGRELVNYLMKNLGYTTAQYY
jgi:lipoyl(octanoyl) transferase